MFDFGVCEPTLTKLSRSLPLEGRTVIEVAEAFTPDEKGSQRSTAETFRNSGFRFYLRSPPLALEEVHVAISEQIDAVIARDPLC